MSDWWNGGDKRLAPEGRDFGCGEREREKKTDREMSPGWDG